MNRKSLPVLLVFVALACFARAQINVTLQGGASPYVLKHPTAADFGTANGFPRIGSAQTWTGAQTFNGATTFGGPVSFGSVALTFGAGQISWASVSKTGSSLADLTTRSASDLSSGTLPDARFPATLPAASGANLTALNASNLASGTIPDARFPATLPAASGANLTALNASNLASGTIPDARFPATLPAASGANLTALNATNLASGTVAAARMPAFTGDASSSAGATSLTLATVNSNVGTFGSATAAPQIVLDGKGRATSAGNVTIMPAVGSITGLGTGVATALGATPNATGGIVTFGGNIGAATGTTLTLTGALSVGPNTTIQPSSSGYLVVSGNSNSLYLDSPPAGGHVYQRVNGATVTDASSTGFAVTGNLSSTGTLTVGVNNSALGTVKLLSTVGTNASPSYAKLTFSNYNDTSEKAYIRNANREANSSRSTVDIGVMSAAGTLFTGLSVDGDSGTSVTGNLAVSGSLTLPADKTLSAGTVTDGYITLTTAQINRSAGSVELQYNKTTAGENVHIFGNTANRWAWQADTGRVVLGSSGDTNLYRSAADTLRTDDNFIAGGNLTAAGNIAASGNRPITLKGGEAQVEVRASTGGWDGVGLEFQGSSGTVGGALFAQGSADTTATIYLGYGATPNTDKRLEFGSTATVIRGSNSTGPVHLYSGDLGTGTTVAEFSSGSGTTTGTRIRGDGALQVRNTSSVTGIRTATATLDFGSIAAGAQADLTVTVTGAATGDSVALGLPASPAAGIVFNAFPSAANTITVRASNITGSPVDPASASYRVTVTSF